MNCPAPLLPVQVVAFVKGTRTQPQCGFSYKVLTILQEVSEAAGQRSSGGKQPAMRSQPPASRPAALPALRLPLCPSLPLYQAPLTQLVLPCSHSFFPAVWR